MKKGIKLAVMASTAVLLASPFLGASAILGSSATTVEATTNSQSEAIGKAILVELNNLRSQNGENTLTGVYVLTNMAQGRAEHLSNIGKLDGHSGYNYQSGAPYIGVAGENIGYWYNPSITDPTKIAKQIIQDLYDDEGVATFGHRKNMLNPYFKHVGIGVSINPSTGYIYYAQDFGSTSAEVGNDNYNGAKDYSEYTSQTGLSAQYPSTYNQNASTTTSESIFSGATQINSVVTASSLTPLFSSPLGTKSNRQLAANSAWYTDQVFTDKYGNNWYRVSTNEWAPINHANIRNL
jgi:uncharacterized protein YkwD